MSPIKTFCVGLCVCVCVCVCAQAPTDPHLSSLIFALIHPVQLMHTLHKHSQAGNLMAQQLVIKAAYLLLGETRTHKWPYFSVRCI